MPADPARVVLVPGLGLDARLGSGCGAGSAAGAARRAGRAMTVQTHRADVARIAGRPPATDRRCARAPRVSLPHTGGRRGLEGPEAGLRPRWRTACAGEDPRGLPGGTVGDVLTRRRDQDRPTEDAGRELLHRGGRGATTDEQHRSRTPLGDQRLDSVGQPAQQALHGGRAQYAGVDVRRVRPWTAPSPGAGWVCAPLEVGDEDQPAGAGRRRQREVGQHRVVDPEQGGRGVEHPGGVEGRDQREVVARRVGEPGHCPGDIGDRRRRDPGDDPGGADRDDDVPGRAASPSAAAALSPVPGPSTAVAPARTPTGSAGPATRGTAGRRPRRASSSRSARYSPVRADQ